MSSYYTGQLVRLSVAFTVNGVATDPTTVTCKVKQPDGTTVTKTYAASEVVRDSTGNYHYDYAVTQAGWHYYAFAGTGTVQAAAEGAFAGITSMG